MQKRRQKGNHQAEHLSLHKYICCFNRVAENQSGSTPMFGNSNSAHFVERFFGMVFLQQQQIPKSHKEPSNKINKASLTSYTMTVCQHLRLDIFVDIAHDQLGQLPL